MNNVNYVRYLLPAFAMLCAVVAQAQDSSGQLDRLELDSSSITGNEELPKVMYIVPWKDADIGDLQGKPAHSLLDEVLAPLDREVFRRQVRYFDQLSSAEEAAEGTK